MALSVARTYGFYVATTILGHGQRYLAMTCFLNGQKWGNPLCRKNRRKQAPGDSNVVKLCRFRKHKIWKHYICYAIRDYPNWLLAYITAAQILFLNYETISLYFRLPVDSYCTSIRWVQNSCVLCNSENDRIRNTTTSNNIEQHRCCFEGIKRMNLSFNLSIECDLYHALRCLFSALIDLCLFIVQNTWIWSSDEDISSIIFRQN